MDRLGIDIGGTGIKGALVDLDTGQLATPRYRLDTPKGGDVTAVLEVLRHVAEHLGGEGPVGVAFPGVVLDGVIMTAANVDKSWIGVDGRAAFEAVIGRPVHAMNDADAAGVAEMRYGIGKARRGVVVMVTLGTGIGTAVFVDGVLVPNTELGHIELGGVDAEELASGSAQERNKLSWKAYAKQLQAYLRRLDALLWPNLMILGGGVSKESHKFLHRMDVRCELVVAELRNAAGIVGAAALADSVLGSTA